MVCKFIQMRALFSIRRQLVASHTMLAVSYPAGAANVSQVLTLPAGSAGGPQSVAVVSHDPIPGMSACCIMLGGLQSIAQLAYRHHRSHATMKAGSYPFVSLWLHAVKLPIHSHAPLQAQTTPREQWWVLEGRLHGAAVPLDV
jgi:hypothetical protein